MYELLIGHLPFEAKGGAVQRIGIGVGSKCCQRGMSGQETGGRESAGGGAAMAGGGLCVHSQILYRSPPLEESLDIWARDLMLRFLVRMSSALFAWPCEHHAMRQRPLLSSVCFFHPSGQIVEHSIDRFPLSPFPNLLHPRTSLIDL